MVADACLWTEKDLDAIPDDGGWTRYEIVSGELLVTRAPHAFHQRAAGNLHIYLGMWSKETQLGEFFQAPGLVFSASDAVIPDGIWISKERLAEALDEAGHFTIAPELVVEVLSAGDRNQERDRETKLRFYSRHGVREYWIASWQQQTIEVYRRANQQLALVDTLGIEDTLSSPQLPGFSVAIAQILA